MTLYAHYEGDESTTRDSATSMRQAATTYTGLVGELVTRRGTALNEVSGILSLPLSSSITGQQTSAAALARASHLGAGVCELFADSIGIYNSGIDELNTRWEQAAANDFGVGPAVCRADETVEESEANRAALVATARQALRRQLDDERAALLETLEDDGRTAAAMLDAGPDDSETVGRLMAAGLIPMTGMSAVFPSATIDLAKTLGQTAGHAWKGINAPQRILAIRQLILKTNDLEALSEILRNTTQNWDEVIRAIDASDLIDNNSMAALTTWLRRAEDIGNATDAVNTARTGVNAAQASVVQRLGLASKFGKGMAGLSVIGGGFGLVDTISNWDELSTTRRVTQTTENVASIASGVAGIAIIAGATGPAAPIVFVGAGLVAGGLAIYNNWDTISSGISTATDWAGDRISDLGDGLSSVKDKASSVIDKITPW